MDTTSSASLPFPESTDLPEANTHIEGLAQSCDLLTLPRYADASARATAIPSPTNGQAAYLQDTEQLNFFKSGYSDWMPVNRPKIFKMKTAIESLSSSATLQDDNHITGIVLKANTWYTIKGHLWFSSGTTEDIKFALNWTSAPSNSDSFWCIKNNQGTSSLESRSATVNTTIAPATTGGVIHSGSVEGIVLVPGVSVTVKLQWAQNTSGGATTSVQAGTWMEFVEAF